MNPTVLKSTGHVMVLFCVCVATLSFNEVPHAANSDIGFLLRKKIQEYS